MPYISNKQDYRENVKKIVEILNTKDDDRKMAELSYIISALLVNSLPVDVTGVFKMLGILSVTESELRQSVSHPIELPVIDKRLREIYPPLDSKGNVHNMTLLQKIQDYYRLGE